MPEMKKITGDSVMLGIVPKALGMPDKYPKTELYQQQPKSTHLIIAFAKTLVTTLSSYGDHYRWGKYHFLSPHFRLRSSLGHLPAPGNRGWKFDGRVSKAVSEGAGLFSFI